MNGVRLVLKAIRGIDNMAFGSCFKLTSITFEGTPTTMNSNAFYQCNKLVTINIPCAEGAVAGAPWCGGGTLYATINYKYTCG